MKNNFFFQIILQIIWNKKKLSFNILLLATYNIRNQKISKIKQKLHFKIFIWLFSLLTYYETIFFSVHLIITKMIKLIMKRFSFSQILWQHKIRIFVLIRFWYIWMYYARVINILIHSNHKNNIYNFTMIQLIKTKRSVVLILFIRWFGKTSIKIISLIQVFLFFFLFLDFQNLFCS